MGVRKSCVWVFGPVFAACTFDLHFPGNGSEGGQGTETGEDDDDDDDDDDDESEGEGESEGEEEETSADTEMGGDCCRAHASPACDDLEVAECVCQVDPFCCDVAWDSACVDIVEPLGCGFCGGSDVSASSADETCGDDSDGTSMGMSESDVRFGVIENSLDALAFFSLEDAMNAIAAPERTGRELYNNLIDTYASEGNGRLEIEHCTGELNGFRMDCDRLEHLQFDNLDTWFATAVVNRIDLAPLDGAHCGQQRVIFANNTPIGSGRMFIIMEAVIPNPQPACGVAGCQRLAEAWEDIARQPGEIRGAMLRDLFLGGGFGLPPLFSRAHFGPQAGQIRTNNFNDFIWTLREFAVVDPPQGPSPLVIAVPTAEAPPGMLWEDAVDSRGEACQEAFLASIPNLLTNEPAAMSFPVPVECRDAESRNDFSQFYPGALGGAFATRIEQELDELGSPLRAFEIAARAQFAGSCIGCHEEAVGSDLGEGVSAPFSAGFVHVDEFSAQPCEDGGTCRFLSDGLVREFLPHRRSVMRTLLDMPSCGSSGDESGGSEGATESGPGGSDGGAGGTTGAATTGDATTGGATTGPSSDAESGPDDAGGGSESGGDVTVGEAVPLRRRPATRTLGGQSVLIRH